MRCARSPHGKAAPVDRKTTDRMAALRRIHALYRGPSPFAMGLTLFAAGANNASASSSSRRRRMTILSALPTLLLEAAPDPAKAGGGRPPMAYVLAGILAVVALYLLIRLLIWDRINQETPNQEEPLFKEPEEPTHERR